MSELNLLEENKEESKFQCRLLGLFYEDLLVSIFKKEGYRILAGERNNQGIVIRPKVYKDKTTRPTIFDFLLVKEGEFLLVEAKCWPLFHPVFDERMRNAIRQNKTDQKFGLNPMLWERNLEVVYNEGTSVKDPKRVLLFWKTETGGKADFEQNGVRVEVWPIYDLFFRMITGKGNGFKSEFLRVLESYEKYSTRLFNYFRR